MLAVRSRVRHNGAPPPNPVLGVRVSANCRDDMARFCRSRGLKMGEFVEQAIREQMERISARGRDPRSREEARQAWDELSRLLTRLWQNPIAAIQAQRDRPWPRGAVR